MLDQSHDKSQNNNKHFVGKQAASYLSLVTMHGASNKMFVDEVNEELVKFLKVGITADRVVWFCWFVGFCAIVLATFWTCINLLKLVVLRPTSASPARPIRNDWRYAEHVHRVSPCVVDFVLVFLCFCFLNSFSNHSHRRSTAFLLNNYIPPLIRSQPFPTFALPSTPSSVLVPPPNHAAGVRAWRLRRHLRRRRQAVLHPHSPPGILF